MLLLPLTIPPTHIILWPSFVTAVSSISTAVVRFPPPLPPSAAASTTISSADLDKLQVLGHGNGGTVYKVRHKQTSAIYAPEVVHGDNDPAVRQQILREVSILRRTDSPHVIKCHGVFDLPGGDIGFCMQYMDM